MKHSFFYKEIGQLDKALLSTLQEKVPNYSYEPDPDFYHGIITTGKLNTYDMASILNDLSRYFKITGHIGTNIALMKPMTYLNEHSDLATKHELNILRKNNNSTAVKLQIPIITNDKVAMMWRNSTPELNKQSNVVNFKIGKIYIINNIDPHCAINLSNSPRYFITSRFHMDSVLDKTSIE